MSRRIRLLLLALALHGAAAGEAHAAENRLTLWPVVRTCVAAYRMLGVPFPCLKVALPGGGLDRGDVVLRPFKSEDLILSPTRQIAGVEDRTLQSSEAPNYFGDAWGERAFLKSRDETAPPRDAVALIVNSRAARSQDQLHIHIACLKPEPRRLLAEAAERMPLNQWTRVGPIVRGQVYFGERVSEKDFASLNPFRMAAGAFVGAADRPQGLMVMVVGARVKDEDDLLIVGFFEGVAGALTHAGAEELMDRSCTAASPFD